MNFQQAKIKLKKLAKGKYHSIQYEITDYGDGKLKQECTVYIDGNKFYYGETWEITFKKLNTALNPPPKQKVVIDSIEEIKKEV